MWQAYLSPLLFARGTGSSHCTMSSQQVMAAYQTQLWMAGAIGCACCQANGVAPPHSPPPAVPPVVARPKRDLWEGLPCTPVGPPRRRDREACPGRRRKRRARKGVGVRRQERERRHGRHGGAFERDVARFWLRKGFRMQGRQGTGCRLFTTTTVVVGVAYDLVSNGHGADVVDSSVAYGSPEAHIRRGQQRCGGRNGTCSVRQPHAGTV